VDLDFIRGLQHRVASSAWAHPAGGGPEGAAAAAARRFCARLELGTFAVRRGGTFLSRLETSTVRLARSLPYSGRSWGAARAFLDRFLREALYNRYICAYFGLEKAEEWLELPLDAIVAQRLRLSCPGCGLPPWRSVKSLTPAMNTNYQAVAARIAAEKGIARVHLDAVLWPPSPGWRGARPRH
jgi:hypothetical protein